jgi:hypothetical protein
MDIIIGYEQSLKVCLRQSFMILLSNRNESIVFGGGEGICSFAFTQEMIRHTKVLTD